jgi:hypothetical protein
MTEPRDSTAPLMSLRLGIALVLVSAIAFIGALVLSAFASDFRSEVNGGTNALSQSAVGFAGLYVLLKESGVQVSIDRRGVAGLQEDSPLILTPDFTTSASALQKLALSRPTLIVLPKWATQPDPFHMGWVSKIGIYPSSVATELLQPLSKSTTIEQGKGVAAAHLHAAGDGFFRNVWSRPVTVDSLQTIGGKDWVPDVVDANGHAILAHLHGKDMYVLADPDFLNTHALKDREVARTAVVLINTWRADDDSIAFDVTLNGFGTPPSLLRAAFQPPFLGATLCALLASILIGYHAASRFGTPVRPEQVYAFGKTMLVNNSAGLIRMLDRERGMAARYAAAARDLVSRLAGGRRDLPPEALLSLEKRAHSSRPYTELSAEAQSVRSNAGMLKVARELYQWRVGITHDDRA